MDLRTKCANGAFSGGVNPHKPSFSFKELFADFIAGTPIKRKTWKGYWKYRHGAIEMHCADGSTTNFTDTKDILFTVSGILQNDWEVATPENSTLEEK
ncbi:MAG: hypothetical protein PHE79_11795 [Eubacteriales bacterium]|nr:hypothetical protein [Eubacteriales bacterium]